MTIPDRIVVMNRCRIEQIGAPLDPYDRPANQFVAGFIGSPSMNFLNGTITEASFQTSGVVRPRLGLWTPLWGGLPFTGFIPNTFD